MTPSSKSWRFWVVKISGNGYRYETREILAGETVSLTGKDLSILYWTFGKRSRDNCELLSLPIRSPENLSKFPKAILFYLTKPLHLGNDFEKMVEHVVMAWSSLLPIYLKARTMPEVFVFNFLQVQSIPTFHFDASKLDLHFVVCIHRHQHHQFAETF